MGESLVFRTRGRRPVTKLHKNLYNVTSRFLMAPNRLRGKGLQYVKNGGEKFFGTGGGDSEQGFLLLLRIICKKAGSTDVL